MVCSLLARGADHVNKVADEINASGGHVSCGWIQRGILIII